MGKASGEAGAFSAFMDRAGSWGTPAMENWFLRRSNCTNLANSLHTPSPYLVENTTTPFGRAVALLSPVLEGANVIVFALIAAIVALVAVSFTSSILSSPRSRS